MQIMTMAEYKDIYLCEKGEKNYVRRMTMSEYISRYENGDFPFLDLRDSTANSVPSFLKDAGFQNILSSYMDANHGEERMFLLHNADIYAAETVRKRITRLYAANKYMLEHLYETTQIEYNPIENYDMEEGWSEKHSGTDTDTRNNGKRVASEKIGERNDATILDKRHNVTSTDVSPQSQVSYVAVNRDTSDTNAVTDNYKYGTQRNETTFDSYVDTDSFKHGHMIDHTLKRSGNIGVTTTQQMIQSEREISNFNIYKVIADIIISAVCVRVYTMF